MENLPWWAWLIGVAGVVAIVAGGLLDDSYTRDVLANLGIAALLVVPLIGIERAIVNTINARAVEARAVDEAEAAVRMNELWADFGERLQKPRPLPTTDPPTALRMLKLDGWSPAPAIRGHAIWRQGSRVVAIPDDRTPMTYSVQRLLRDRAGWTTERYVDLYERASTGDTPVTSRDDANP
jgi:hypothetical protein